MSRIAFITANFSRFIEQDLETLRSRHDVHVVHWTGKSKLPRLLYEVGAADLSFCYFAADHAWLAATAGRWTRTRCVIVTGGNDVAEVPDIGFFLSAKSKRRTRKALERCDLALLFSQSSMHDMHQVGAPPRAEVLYLGVDPEEFYPQGPKQDLAITAGWVNQSNLLRKGHEPFIRAAAFLPEVEFRLVYPATDDGAEPAALAHLRQIATPNVTFSTDEAIHTDFQRAKVYVQASGHEGFGLANAEAMASACVPVVVDRYALPEVVAETGEYVRFNDPEDLARGIKRALSRDGSAARERVIKNYTGRHRRDRLLELVDEILAA